MKKDKNNQNNQEPKNQKEVKEQVNETEVEHNQLVDLQVQVSQLKKELENKNTLIQNLESQIALLNENFKTEILKKASEAQAKLEQKIQEYATKYETELKNAKKFALKDKAVDLIGIISNFNNAVNMPSKNPEVANYVQGFKMFSNMFKSYLEDNSIFEININLGDEYDPKTMEAFETVNSDKFKTNQVTKVVKKGYKLHDVVIVPALVTVAK